MTEDPQARLAAAEQDILSRRPEHSIEPTLDRIRALTELLGDPQRAYPVIHITGTNGKTSTARMIETLLRARGLRTGLFTSPHLSSMRERICVDGQPLSAERFADAYDEIVPYLDLIDASQPVRLSFFEVLTAMAFAVFADSPVDVAVIEVGVGGTWDCTNVADGAVAVVTPVSIDHTRYLGSTIPAIAADKAGIIKPGSVAVLAQQQLEAAEVLLRRAAEVGAAVAREGLEFGVTSRELAVGGQLLGVRGLLGSYEELFLPLFGAYQASNAACALAAVEAFAGASAVDTAGHGAGGVGPDGEPTPLDDELVRRAFSEMSSPGRLEVVRRSPLVLVDSAHNPAGHGGDRGGGNGVVHFQRAGGGHRGQRGQGRARDTRRAGAGSSAADRNRQLVGQVAGARQARRPRGQRVRPGAGHRDRPAGRRDRGRGPAGRRMGRGRGPRRGPAGQRSGARDRLGGHRR